MARNLERLLLRVEGDTRQVKTDLRDLEQHSVRTSDRISIAFKKSGAGLDKFAQSAKRSAPILAAAFLAASTAAFKVAADVEEMESKFRAVFRDSSADVERWAVSHGDAIGRSRLSLMEYASTLQDTFVPMGFARGEAAELSKELTELAIDMASFNNAAEGETVNLLTSALVGNHEAVRRYGIILTEQTLKQELVSSGMVAQAKDASELQKVQARLNIIMRNTSDAHGDAERTAGSATNQLKAYNDGVRDLAASFGKNLLPAGIKLVEWGNDFNDVLGWVIDKFTTLNNMSAPALADNLAELKAEREKISKALSSALSDPSFAAEEATGKGGTLVMAARAEVQKLDAAAREIDAKIKEIEGIISGREKPVSAVPDTPAAVSSPQGFGSDALSDFKKAIDEARKERDRAAEEGQKFLADAEKAALRASGKQIELIKVEEAERLASVERQLLSEEEKERARVAIATRAADEIAGVHREQADEAARLAEDVARKQAEAFQGVSQVIDGVSADVSSSLAEMVVTGERSALQFDRIFQRILSQIIEAQFIAPLANAGGSFLTSFFASKQGNVFSGGSVVPFANGGVINGPMTFPLSGGRTGLAGEAGAEAIMPLTRLPGGDLGVRSSGGSGGGVTLVVNMNGAKGDTEQRTFKDGRGGQRIELEISNIVADNVRGGGSVFRAIQETTGVDRQPIRRG